MTIGRLLLAPVMVLCFAGSALADDWADCDQQAELDRTISGCSNIIAAGRDGPQKLALAYVNRGLAYLVKGYGWEVPFLVASGLCFIAGATFWKVDATRRISFGS